MTIGTSLGAFHENEFQMEAAPWFIDPKKEDSDNNIIDPDIDHGSTTPLPNPIIRASYDTPLPVGDKGFKDWKAKYAPNDSGEDYDLQGAYLARVIPAENGHFPDTWKKPNHPTFSDQSKYYTKDTPAGTWNGDEFIPPSIQ